VSPDDNSPDDNSPDDNGPMALKGGNLIDDRAGCSLIICLVINRSVINPPELLSLLPGEYSPVKVSLTKQVDSSHQSQ
jgi:hypothetical protein